MTIEGGELSLMMFWNSEKLSNFKAHELKWTVNELCTCLIIDEKISSSLSDCNGTRTHNHLVR